LRGAGLCWRDYWQLWVKFCWTFARKKGKTRFVMRQRLTSRKFWGHRGIALLLLFYLSGAACAFNCEMLACESATPMVTAQPEAESCETGESHDCCRRGGKPKANRRAARQPEAPAPKPGECCALYRRAPFDATQKVSLDPPALVAETQPWRYVAPLRQAFKPAQVVANLPRPPNLPPVYLLCCVFLI
jgi:hypothetical protein